MKQTSTADDEIRALHKRVEMLLGQGLSNNQIINDLKDKGLEPYYIETIIQNIIEEKEDKKSFRNSMIMGIFFVIAGVAVNILSYNISDNIGSTGFLLFWGIIVTGIVTIVRGFILYK